MGVIVFRKCDLKKKNAVKLPSRKNQERCCFSDLMNHAGHK